jgi:hypothetical protein
MRTEKLRSGHMEGICELWNHPDFLSEGSFVVEEESSDCTVGIVISKAPRFGVGYISVLLVDSRYRKA